MSPPTTKPTEGGDTQEVALPTSWTWINNWYSNLRDTEKETFGKRKSYSLTPESFLSLLEVGQFSFANSRDNLTFEVTVIDRRRKVTKTGRIL